MSCLKITTSTFSSDAEETHESSSCSDNSSSLRSSINNDGGCKKKLAWDSLEIIEFPMELGSHPSVSHGAPIAMGQQEMSRRTFDLYHYDVLIHGAGGDNYRERPNKTLDELRLSAPERAGILLRAGYTVNQIVDGAQEAAEYRKLREESYQNQSWDRVSETMERTARKVKQILTLNAKSA